MKIFSQAFSWALIVNLRENSSGQSVLYEKGNQQREAICLPMDIDYGMKRIQVLLLTKILAANFSLA